MLINKKDNAPLQFNKHAKNGQMVDRRSQYESRMENRMSHAKNFIIAKEKE